MEEQKTRGRKKENFNPLKKEIVEVRYIPSTSTMYSGADSPLRGGLAESASITYSVPKENGMIVPVLTVDEQEFFETLFNLPEGAMGNHVINNNYWSTYNRGYINRVTLGKLGKKLDLSKPIDYIEYKILLANKEYICPNQETLENARRATYRFVLNNDNTVAESVSKNAEIKVELFGVFSKVKDDADMLRTILYLVNHKKVSPKTRIELLKDLIVNLIETRSKDCYSVMTSKTLDQKKAVIVGAEKGVISDRNGFFYLNETGQKLSDDYEEPNLNNAANYLADVKNQELYFSILKKIQ